MQPSVSGSPRPHPCHDIGKVGIPDAILLKPGKLTVEEFEIMKTHAAIGADTISEAVKRVGHGAGGEAVDAPLAFLDTARQIAGGRASKMGWFRLPQRTSRRSNTGGGPG